MKVVTMVTLENKGEQRRIIVFKKAQFKLIQFNPIKFN